LLRAYAIPLGTFTVSDPSSKTGGRKLAPGVPPISDSDSRPDVKACLIRIGVPFPPGSDASYQADIPYLPCLVVRQTQKNLDLLDTLLLPMSDGVPMQLEVGISAYRLSSAEMCSLPEDGKWNPDAIQRLEKSAFFLDRVVCLAKSGQSTEVSHRQGKDTCHAEVVPFVGADGLTTDLQLDYRLKIAEAAPNQPLEITAKTSVRVADGHTVLVKAAAVPSKPDRKAKRQNVILVLRVSILNAAGWSLNEADGTAKP
jgi:hypothetical protein